MRAERGTYGSYLAFEDLTLDEIVDNVESQVWGLRRIYTMLQINSRSRDARVAQFARYFRGKVQESLHHFNITRRRLRGIAQLEYNYEWVDLVEVTPLPPQVPGGLL